MDPQNVIALIRISYHPCKFSLRKKKRITQCSINLAGVSTAVTGATTFNETTTTGSVATGDTITGIGICSDKGSLADNQGVLNAFDTGCATGAGSPPLIAAVDTSDITLNADETVTITYTLTLE